MMFFINISLYFFKKFHISRKFTYNAAEICEISWPVLQIGKKIQVGIRVLINIFITE